MINNKKTKLRVQDNYKSRDAMKPKVQAALDAGDVQEVIDNLTVRQRRFAEEYIVDYNAKEAVIRAGYNTKWPNRLANEMLKHPGIRAAIDQITLERASDAVIKPDYVFQKIQKTINRAEEDNNHNAVLRGCELLARALGMFIERKEISGPNGDAIQLKQVQDAADAFTSAISGLVERGREGESFIIVGPES
jgi:hypothetical protein